MRRSNLKTCLAIDWRGWILPTIGEAIVIALIFFAGIRCHAFEPPLGSPNPTFIPPRVYVAAPALMPVQPVAVATYHPIASWIWGPTFTYHVAYVLRPVAPPAAVPPVPAQPVGGQP